jgi:hypothetical protein
MGQYVSHVLFVVSYFFDEFETAVLFGMVEKGG